MKSDNLPSIVLLCSPNLGVLENWLPIFAELKRTNSQVRISCLISKSSTSALIDIDNDLVKIAENYIDEVIFKSYMNHWINVETLSESKKANNLSLLFKALTRVDNYIRLHSFTFISNIFSKAIRFFLYLHYYKYDSKKIDISNFLMNSKCLLCDIVDVQKGIHSYNDFLATVYPHLICFSMHHGVNIGLDPVFKNSDWLKAQVPDNKKTTYYLFNKVDESFYQDYYNINEDDQMRIGVPRHELKWMRQIIRQQANLSDKYQKKPYVLVISRPLSNFLPLERKKKILQDIKKLVIDNLDFNLVIKCHPKEKDLTIYEQALGNDQYNKNWFYSKRHPFILAESCKFAITLYSSLCTDFILLGIPVIEYLNLNDLATHDSPDALRDKSDNPVLDYRYHGMVLGVDNFEDLEKNAHKILKNKVEVLSELKNKYQKIFYITDNPSKTVASDIMQKIVN